MAETKIPTDYGWPGGDVVGSRPGPLYWLSPHDDGSATQLYMVIAAMPEGQHIAAQSCYLHWGIKIVDALRAAAS